MEPEGSLPHSLVPATVPILSQLDPVHTPTAHFLKIRPNNYFEFWNNLKKYKDNGVCMCVWCVCICVRVVCVYMCVCVCVWCVCVCVCVCVVCVLKEYYNCYSSKL